MASEVLELVVDTGSITVPVKDKKGNLLGEFEFNPLDSNMLSRYDKVIDFFNNIKFNDELEEAEQVHEIEKISQDIAEQFDYMFGYKVSDGIFGRCGALTVVDNGDFYFENVLEGIGVLMEKVMKVRVNKKLAKIRKATNSKKH